MRQLSCQHKKADPLPVCSANRPPLFKGRCKTSSMHHFEQTGSTHAATDAHRDNREFRLAAAAFDQSVTGQPRARHPVGMTDRDRAAIDIDLLRVDAEFVAAIKHLHGKRLVQFPEIDILDLQAVTLQQPRYCKYRPDAHLVRLAAGGDKTAEDAERLQATLGSFL